MRKGLIKNVQVVQSKNQLNRSLIHLNYYETLRAMRIEYERNLINEKIEQLSVFINIALDTKNESEFRRLSKEYITLKNGK